MECGEHLYLVLLEETHDELVTYPEELTDVVSDLMLGREHPARRWQYRYPAVLVNEHDSLIFD